MINLDQCVDEALSALSHSSTGGRTLNVLRNIDVRTLRDLVGKTEVDLLRQQNFGKLSLRRLKDELAKLGLTLDMQMPAAPAASAWQPMFTAPRDGTRIIALRVDFSGVAIIRLGHTAAGHPEWHELVFGVEWAGWILNDWLREKQYSKPIFMGQLEKQFGVKHVKARLGAGTAHAALPEYLLEIDIAATPLLNFIDEA